MAFQVTVTGVDELAGRQMMTEVKVERRLYGHSAAHAVIRWQETEGFQDRPAALLAAKCLSCPVEIVWRDNDLAESAPCFRGYVQHASAQRLPALSAPTLECVSYTKRADLVPRFRAFQATTLHDITEQIARAEPLIKIITAADLHVPVALSLQHAETDFAYLSRMLRASGVPLATDDMTGRVLLGARSKEPSTPFPDTDWGWSPVTFSGALHALPSLVQSGTGATGIARSALGGFLGQLTRLAADYHATPLHPEMSAAHAQTSSQTDTSGYQMHLDGAVLPHAPGDVVEVEGRQHLIHAVSITGHPQQATASQLFQLQPLTLPLSPGHALPQWPSRALWAYVTDNERDPLQQGRVQVRGRPGVARLDPPRGGHEVPHLPTCRRGLPVFVLGQGH